MKDKTKIILGIGTGFLLFALLLIGVFVPDNVLLADIGNEQGPTSFLPVIFGFTANDNLVTPTSTAEVTATNTPVETATLTMTPTQTPTTTATSLPCMTGEDNLIRNPGFESDTADWNFFTNEQGNFITVLPGYECLSAAQLSLDQIGSNVQLNQTGFQLKDNTRYRLGFAAYSNTGNDLKVFVHRDSQPYTTYGLNGAKLDLSTTWQNFSMEFLTKNIVGQTNDTRLRFWFPGLATNGDIYWIDEVVLEEIGPGPEQTATATQTPKPETTATATRTPKPGTTFTPTPTPRPGTTPTPTPRPGGGKELLVYDWNGPVTEKNKGFPWEQPPRNNFDWTKPVNYAGGTLHFRVEIRKQPVAQDMKLQFCFWQEKNGNNFGLESCGLLQSVRGTSGTVETWSQSVASMWKLNGKPIEWDRPRFRDSAVIKNKNGLPVSDFNGWKWNGEDPKKWYPLDMRFTVVVVADGAQFTGWEKYIDN